jgi:hypothetical protein
MCVSASGVEAGNYSSGHPSWVESATSQTISVEHKMNSYTNQNLKTPPAIPVVRRSMETKVTPSGKVVTCAVCSWWAPMMRQDISAAAEEFEAHICTEHPPVKGRY